MYRHNPLPEDLGESFRSKSKESLKNIVFSSEKFKLTNYNKENTIKQCIKIKKTMSKEKELHKISSK